MNNEQDLSALVAAGVEYLDRTDPGWRERIDPNTLDMSLQNTCIRGQLYGDFYSGRNLPQPGEVEDQTPALVALGFICDTRRNCYCAQLTPLWLEHLGEAS